ncbi:DUF2069 domain-containing protein [Diaphorobacter sp. HDW4A]|uniref:DUF2069 domain-containing protein n=1 Tax=Diaphorobacter sp. HDW4A TaxID=2714924 RepID=UPI00140D654A|nr:DUF2069 domain-containing protein [Diaphorobacter sp. HDW4A]QIL79002.1 DUF2069 domain-containing protein [Diaphorobacter sp. HDW4A]
MTASAPNDSAAPLAVQGDVAITRWLAVGSLLGLIVLSVLWELWLAPLRPGGSWLVLKALPLCIPLAGLLKRRMYTYRWVSLVVWLYFTEGVVRAWSDKAPGNWLAMIEIALCLLLFIACALHVRLRQKAARQSTAKAG